jgi:tetratricopeptide (TPR) repeat protein
MRYDAAGLTITAANDAVAPWNDTVENVLAHAAEAPVSLGRALSADPDFAMASAAKGLMLLTMARAELVGPAHDALATAKRAAAQRPITPREQGYLDALSHWLEGAPRRAAATLEAVVAAAPHDALALKLSHAIRFMLGDRDAMLAALDAAAPAFTPDVAHAGFIHGCHAFALEEAGHFAAAERSGRLAVELAPRDAWGRHAVAHVMEMTGRVQEGAAWLAAARTWSHTNNFRYHMFWHLALFRLELGDVEEVLRLYDEEIRAEATDDFRDVANAASLLARLEFEGVDVGQRWHEIADISERRVLDRRLAFADLHYLIALLGAGDLTTADALARGLTTDAALGEGSERRQSARTGAAAAKGLIAFATGEYADAARLLGDARPGLVGIGGSNAQRDVFEQAYIESLIRSGDFERASTILAERLTARGGSNGFAARRLARLTGRRSAPVRTALLAVAALGSAVSH